MFGRVIASWTSKPPPPAHYTSVPLSPEDLPPENPTARRGTPTTASPFARVLSITSVPLRISLAALLFISLSLFIFWSSPPPPHPYCSPQAYSDGKWIPKQPPLHDNTSHVDIFQASGFQGCAHWFKPEWYLGAEANLEMSKYRWDAAQYEWRPQDPVCETVAREAMAEEMIWDLVERGGWLLMGDSLVEQQFFGLSCMLYPHVQVKWGGGGWQEQHLYLEPASPLVPRLRLPHDFSFDTPLITNLRTDHGFTTSELESIYTSTPESATTPVSSLFTDYPLISPPINSYFDRFLDSTHHYHALIMSTAAHWTTREFAFPEGLPAIVPFYAAAVEEWARTAERFLEMDTTGRREVLVRAASAGHDQCHEHFAPWEEVPEGEPEHFNWGLIPTLNDKFEAAVAKINHPRLAFLSIDRPGRLRPDGHANDCLHVAVGVGVIEGWSSYIAYFLRSHTRM